MVALIVDVEWYIFFQSYWIQNIMAFIFAIIFFMLMCYEFFDEDKIYITTVPKESPTKEKFEE